MVIPLGVLVGGGCCLAAAAIKSYMVVTTGRYKIDKDLNGKVFIVTGATSGIGKVTAKEIARSGGIVFMPCRNLVKGEKVAEEIRLETGNKNVIVEELDLNSFKSVRKFAEQFLSTKMPLHVLINNAGMIPGNIQNITEDGYDETMQSNHYGHFLLTRLLLERIKQSRPSRIINVASYAHTRVREFDVSDLNCTKRKFYPWQTYRWSKLCNILFTNELAKRLRGSGVTVNSLHPGLIITDIIRNQPFYAWPFICVMWPFLKSVYEGAQTTLYLATSNEVQFVSGHYFADCKPAAQHLFAIDDQLAEQLWRESNKATGLTDN